MSRGAGRAVLAGLRAVCPAWPEGRAVTPRGALPPGRQDNGLRSWSPRLVQPAPLLLLLPLGGGRLRSVAAGAGTHGAPGRTVLGLDARVCRGDVSRRLAGSRAGGGRGIPTKELTALIKGCEDAAGLLTLVEEHGHGFDFIHVGAAWSSLARMRGAGARGAEDVVKLLQVLTTANIQQMGARAVANIVHSMTTLHQSRKMVADDELVGKLMARALATARDFNPQGVANFVWALATMGTEADPRLLEAMQGRATATARDFNPQDVANFVWALATMGVKADPRLLEAMQARATATASDFKPQEVANFVWALATMGVKADPRLLEAMQGRATATAQIGRAACRDRV